MSVEDGSQYEKGNSKSSCSSDKKTGSSEDDRKPEANSVDVSTWKRLETQVGGHLFAHGDHKQQKPGMVDLGNGFVLKALQNPPRGLRELNFYQKVFDPDCTDPDLLELQKFLPSFDGVHEENGVKFLKLANLTSGFKHPCVIDLKMGKVTYDQEATPEKIAQEIAKYPPLKNIGYQITGMMMYDAKTKSNEKYDKQFNNKLNEETMVTEGLGKFFRMDKSEPRKDAIQPILSKLIKLESWFLKQTKFTFVASSIFMVYEGAKFIKAKPSRSTQSNTTKNINDNNDNTIVVDEPCKTSSSNQLKRINSDGILCDVETKRSKLSDDDLITETIINSTEKKIAEVHLIDFAHVFPTKDTDHNFLFGLQNLIKGLQNLLK
ncbi:inositol polyphosphate multikinase-like [Physella acuta]|uniref:inositol polyphosphate multikinase-like n=1 Tax=Physella acuta TaxID=109671 RepID=UPI0027DC07DF|nr:inositol polyphosphate multikinase-like [Physella acuta]XP_059173159.1 inositol polyphosphate multikinase-like [Physella acuta]